MARNKCSCGSSFLLLDESGRVRAQSGSHLQIKLKDCMKINVKSLTKFLRLYLQKDIPWNRI